MSLSWHCAQFIALCTVVSRRMIHWIWQSVEGEDKGNPTLLDGRRRDGVRKEVQELERIELKVSYDGKENMGKKEDFPMEYISNLSEKPREIQ